MKGNLPEKCETVLEHMLPTAEIAPFSCLGFWALFQYWKVWRGPSPENPIPYTLPDSEEEEAETPEVKCSSPLHCRPDLDPSLKSETSENVPGGLGESSKSSPPQPQVQAQGCHGRRRPREAEGVWGEKLGPRSHIPRRGKLCLHRRPPNTLSDRTSCVLVSLFLVRTGRKGSSGAKPPAPSPAASTHTTWFGGKGVGGAPNPQGGRTVLSVTCQHRCWAWWVR